MIEQARGLDRAALGAIAGLERRCLAADGGRLKLEWGVLRSRPADTVRDLLWYEHDRLVAFLGIYTYRTGSFEVTGMVDPDFRRRGIGRALLEAALPLLQAAGGGRLLLVVPRTSPGGRALALTLGMGYEHSEHALRLRRRPAERALRPYEQPAGGPAAAALRLRPASDADVPALSDMYLEAFGAGEVDPARLHAPRSRTLMVLSGDDPIGTVTVVHDGEHGALYGFAVAAAVRGRGAGRQVLRRVCTELFDAGVDHVDLDVEVKNDRALGLYTSVGFELVATDDYYELALR